MPAKKNGAKNDRTMGKTKMGFQSTLKLIRQMLGSCYPIDLNLCQLFVSQVGFLNYSLANVDNFN